MIPSWLISILTFPGVIVHELAHKKFCNWLKVPVLKVVYFRFGNPAGYVLHAEPQQYKQVFWISIGPLIINSLGAVIVSFLASLNDSSSWPYLILIWIAISLGMHSFPSDEDMKHISSASKESLKKGGSSLHYLAFPFVVLVWISNKLRFFWFDLIYAIFLIGLGGAF